MTNGRAGGSRARTVFLGSGGFGVGALRALHRRADIDLVGVVTAPPRPAGRGAQPRPTVIQGVADELGVTPVLAPKRLRDPASIAGVLALEPELAVLADYGQLVPNPLLGLRYGALNLHPSLLPRYRGASPIPATILAGDPETGVTLMRMDEGLDSGPIVAQERVALDGLETAPRLEETLAQVAEGLLDRSLGPWMRGELTAHPQPADEATLTRPLQRDDGRLDPSKRAVELWRQVRAYEPWPGSFVDTSLGRLAVWTASVRPEERGTPGRFAIDGLDTADGRLVLHEVQPAGGRRMAWDAYVRGRPGIVGSAALASEP